MFENLLAITSHLEHAMDNSLQSISGMLSIQFQIQVVMIIIRGPIHYMKDHLKLTERERAIALKCFLLLPVFLVFYVMHLLYNGNLGYE